MNYYALDKNWFKRHQWVFKFLFNFPILKWLLRKRYRLKSYKKFVGMMPDMYRCIVSQKGDEYVMSDVYYTNAVWSMEVVKCIGWWLWALHWLDNFVLDKHIPQWSFGFAELGDSNERGGSVSNGYPFYPDSGLSGPTTDAYLEKIPLVSEVWLQIRESGPTVYRHEGTLMKVSYNIGLIWNYTKWSRIYMSFDTSQLLELPSTAVIWYYDVEAYLIGNTSRDGRPFIAHTKWNDINNHYSRIETSDWGTSNIHISADMRYFGYLERDMPAYFSFCEHGGIKDPDNIQVQMEAVKEMMGGIVKLMLVPPESYNPWNDDEVGWAQGEHGFYASSSDAGASQAPRLTVVYKTTGGIVMVI